MTTIDNKQNMSENEHPRWMLNPQNAKILQVLPNAIIVEIVMVHYITIGCQQIDPDINDKWKVVNIEKTTIYDLRITLENDNGVQRWSDFTKITSYRFPQFYDIKLILEFNEFAICAEDNMSKFVSLLYKPVIIKLSKSFGVIICGDVSICVKSEQTSTIDTAETYTIINNYVFMIIFFFNFPPILLLFFVLKI